MFGLFNWIGSGLKAIGQAIALPFLKVKSSSRLQQAVRWTFHVVCVLMICAGLAFLNFIFRLDSVLLTPFPLLRNLWLPSVFLQVYGLSWLGWWLCRLLTAKAEPVEFPDIEKAWLQAVNALNHASIDIRNTPLFMFIGKPAEATTALFNAGKVVRSITQTPAQADAPFHVLAGDEGVYVCCEGSSLTGRQSMMFANAKRHASEQGANDNSNLANNRFNRPTEAVSPAHFGIFAQDTLPAASTMDSLSGPSLSGAPVNSRLPELGEVSGEGISTSSTSAQATLTRPTTAPPNPTSHQTAVESLAIIDSNIALLDAVDQTKVESTESANEELVYQPARKLVLPLLRNESEIEETTQRLKFLCGLVRKAREPFCSLNGVVVLIPFSATECDDIANHTGILIEQDLQAITDAAEIDAPRLAVFCDIQEVEGCSDLLNRFPEQQKHRRLGIKFPRVPACDRDSMNQMINNGLKWLCQQLIPPIVNRLFHTERSSGGAEQAVNESNQRLYRFMYSIRERQSRFERIVRRGFLGNNQPGELLRGCYLTATGRDTISEQAFTAGVFSQLFEMQNDVRWTDEAIAKDKDLNRWSIFGYFCVATISVVAVLLILL